MLTCEMAPSSGPASSSTAATSPAWTSPRCASSGLTKSYQVNQLFPRLTLRENVVIAALGRTARPLPRSTCCAASTRCRGSPTQVESTLALVGLTARADVPVAELAYGEKRRLEIGLALAASPSLLLLDEPLAGMSPRERADTVQLLKNIRHGRTLVVVEHDMDAVFELAERITVLHEGALLAEGTPAEIQRNSLVQEAYLGGVAAA